jgi:hypothetical protein
MSKLSGYDNGSRNMNFGAEDIPRNNETSFEDSDGLAHAMLVWRMVNIHFVGTGVALGDLNAKRKDHCYYLNLFQ